MDDLPDLSDLTSFRDEGLLGSAPAAGVYLLRRAGMVVYVGQSANLRARFMGHRREKKKDFDETLWYPEDNESARLRIEAILILTLLPTYNQMIHLGLKEGRVWEVRWRKRR